MQHFSKTRWNLDQHDPINRSDDSVNLWSSPLFSVLPKCGHWK